MSGIEPCRACGSKVRVVTVRGEMSAADTRAPIIEKRKCTNRDCETNGRDKPLNSVV